MELGRIGVWSPPMRRAPRADAVAAAVELERLGYGTLWLPGRPSPQADGVFERAAAVLEATERMTVATGIVSVYEIPAAIAAAEHNRLTRAHPGRFLLGLGVSHAPIVDRDAPGRYAHPIATMSAYLDELDAAPEPVPPDQRVIAALGPRMLQLAREPTWACPTTPTTGCDSASRRLISRTAAAIVSSTQSSRGAMRMRFAGASRSICALVRTTWPCRRCARTTRYRWRSGGRSPKRC